MERRTISSVGAEARWNYAVYIYLLIEPKADSDKKQAALQMYVCGFDKAAKQILSAELRGVFIIPIIPGAPQEPNDRTADLMWANSNYDSAIAGQLISSIVSRTNNSRSGIGPASIVFVIANGPLGSHPQIAAYDLTKSSPDKISGWIFDRIQDVETGNAKSQADMERLGVSAGAAFAALGRDFGSMIFQILPDARASTVGCP